VLGRLTPFLQLMRKRAVVMCGLCGVLSIHCTSSNPANPDAGPGATTGDDGGSAAGSLVGTWTLTTTEMVGSSGIQTTVTIGQDSLSVTSPEFTLTATRTGNVLTFTDNEEPGTNSNVATLTATQTAATFNAGLLPFDLGGSWTMQAGPTGGTPTYTCTLSVSAAEIDGACQKVSPASPWFSFTSQKTSSAASMFGDFGGKWNNSWGGMDPCELDFTGSSITTCAGGAVDGEVKGNPLAGITFTYDGANAVSGAAQGWAEFSATR
jgi:hypothetical protein